MDSDLRSIEVETARIRLERERLALQDDLDRRKRVAKVANVSQTVVDTTLAAGGAATDVALTATKLVSKVIFGAIIAGTLSFAWVAAHQWKGDISQLTFDYGFWLGSGGYWFILACAIGYPFVSKNSVETSTSAAAPAVAPQGPSIFERKAKLRRQGKYWLITCAVAAVGGLAHSVLPMSVAELFGGPLTMLAVALPFWALGLLMDLLKISAARMRN